MPRISHESARAEKRKQAHNARRTLALKAIQRIKRHPETWNQRNWHCGTAFCMAGHVCLLAGYEPVNPEASDHDLDGMAVKKPRGNKIDIPDAAMKALGFKMEDHYYGIHPLFESCNSIERLRELVDIHLPYMR